MVARSELNRRSTRMPAPRLRSHRFHLIRARVRVSRAKETDHRSGERPRPPASRPPLHEAGLPEPDGPAPVSCMSPNALYFGRTRADSDQSCAVPLRSRWHNRHVQAPVQRTPAKTAIATTRKILDSLGLPSRPPPVAPARRNPLQWLIGTAVP